MVTTTAFTQKRLTLFFSPASGSRSGFLDRTASFTNQPNFYPRNSPKASPAIRPSARLSK